MTTRPETSIVYPETDGMPLPDGEYQAPLYRRVAGRLEVHFKDIPGARVNGDTFIYYVEGNPRRSVSPDCYVVFGLSDAALRSLSLEGNNNLSAVGGYLQNPVSFIILQCYCII